MLEPSYSLTPSELQFVQFQLESALEDLRKVLETSHSDESNKWLASVEARVLWLQDTLSTGRKGTRT